MSDTIITDFYYQSGDFIVTKDSVTEYDFEILLEIIEKYNHREISGKVYKHFEKKR